MCLGLPEIGDGPIHALLELQGPVTFAKLGLTRDSEGTISADAILVDKGPAIALAGAAVWSPPTLPEVDRERVRQGLAALIAAAIPRAGEDGLARLVLSAGAVKNPSATERAAAGTIAALRKGLTGALRDKNVGTIAPHAVLLLGLGPGLTPSGDDVLGGMMLALSAVGAETVREALWQVLRPELCDLTNEISAMHLAVAADGLGAGAMHRVLAAIVSGDSPAIDAAVADAARIGHCSGLDTLAGIALALVAWLAAA